MIYTELTKKALRIAFAGHKEQVDKTGMPYIFHPFHLAEQMETEEEVIVALLHDVVEDTSLSLKELRTYGFSERVIAALSLLTHQDGIDYMAYIKEIKKNPLAAKVKLADLRHNSDLTRWDTIDERTRQRYEKYKKALVYLAD